MFYAGLFYILVYFNKYFNVKQGFALVSTPASQQILSKKTLNLGVIVNSATNLTLSDILSLLTKLACFEYKFRHVISFLNKSYSSIFCIF